MHAGQGQDHSCLKLDRDRLPPTRAFNDLNTVVVLLIRRGSEDLTYLH